MPTQPDATTPELPLFPVERIDLSWGTKPNRPCTDKAVLFRGYVPVNEADDHLLAINFETPWKQDQILIYNKVEPVPRLSSWYGDRGKTYTYSGKKMHPRPWTDRLQQLKVYAEQAAKAAGEAVEFDSVLLNKYRNEFDGVAWHSDDERELGANPIIASISLGETRKFQLRHKFRKGETPTPIITVDLRHGDVLIMSGTTQRNWMHQVPKRQRPKSDFPAAAAEAPKLGVRLNLTFRTIH